VLSLEEYESKEAADYKPRRRIKAKSRESILGLFLRRFAGLEELMKLRHVK
jgi:hypothetical protein